MPTTFVDHWITSRLGMGDYPLWHCVTYALVTLVGAGRDDEHTLLYSWWTYHLHGLNSTGESNRSVNCDFDFNLLTCVSIKALTVKINNMWTLWPWSSSLLQGGGTGASIIDGTRSPKVWAGEAQPPPATKWFNFFLLSLYFTPTGFYCRTSYE